MKKERNLKESVLIDKVVISGKGSYKEKRNLETVKPRNIGQAQMTAFTQLPYMKELFDKGAVKGNDEILSQTLNVEQESNNDFEHESLRNNASVKGKNNIVVVEHESSKKTIQSKKNLEDKNEYDA